MRHRFAAAEPDVYLKATALALLLAGVAWPLATLFYGSFRVDAGSGAGTFSLANYAFVFTRPRIARALVTTFLASAGSTLVSTVLGVGLAWLTARTNVPGRRALEPFLLLPMFLSPFVGAIAWAYLASPRIGLLNRIFQGALGLDGPPLNIYSVWGIAWVLGLFFTPYVYLFAVGALARMDPALEEAARVCGCGLPGAAGRVVLPMVAPAIASGMVVAFVSSAGEFGVPLALGVPVGIETLTTQVYEVLQQVPADYSLGAAIASLLLVMALGGILLLRRLGRSREYTTVTGRGGGERLTDLGGWRFVGLGAMLAYILVASGLPLMALGLVSVSKVWTGGFDPALLTVAHFRYVLADYPVTQVALRNGLVVSTAAATGAMILATVVAAITVRRRGGLSASLEFLSTLPVGVPGIVLAMGFLIAFIRTPLYGTLILMGLGYAFRFLPYGYRAVASVLHGLAPELEEAARTCGARWVLRTVRIAVPLLRPGIAAGWLMLFIIFLRELPISIMLWAPGNEVISVALYVLLQQKPPGPMAAFALLQAGLVLVAVVAVKRFAEPRTLAET